MKINDFIEMIDYCQRKRNISSCPLMSVSESEGCLVKEICDSFGSGSRIFYFKHIWSLISEDILSVKCGLNKKENVLEKYKNLKILCDKSRFTGDDHSYCGNRCGEFTQHLCKKHLHHSLGKIGPSAVFIQMSEVYPIVKWIFNNLDEFKQKE